MKITVRAGGVLRKGPERELIDDYLKRANGLTRTCGFQSISEQQVDLRKAKTRAEETEHLLDFKPVSVKTIVMDERGKAFTSRQLSKKLAQIRDEGHGELMIVIGGADGFEPDCLPKGVETWAFGIQTWPHKLLRVMLAEQLYRALSILARIPYHRD